MKVVLTEGQLRKVVCEEIAGNQAMVNPRLVYAWLMRQLSMGNISIEDAIKYPENFSGKLRNSLRDLVNRFLNKNQKATGQTQLGAENIKKTATDISNTALSQICKWETLHDFGYKMNAKDLQGYRVKGEGKKTYGYGLRRHPNGNFMEDVKQVWTQQELEELFKQKIGIETQWVLNWAAKNGVELGQGQLDAMVSAVYNYGRTGFLRTGIPAMIAQNQNDPRIPQVWATVSDHRKNMGGLHARRREEAMWYQNDMV